MKPEHIIGIISLVIYVIAMFLKKDKPILSNKIRYFALGLMIVAIVINIFAKQ